MSSTFCLGDEQMRSTVSSLPALLFLCSCHTIGGVSKDTSGPVEFDSASELEADTDTDSDMDTDTDTDTDTDGDMDTDADSDVDLGPQGHYQGAVAVEMISSWMTQECAGQVEVDVDAMGQATGSADCNFSGYWTVKGTIDGALSAGSFSGEWVVDLGWGGGEYSLALEGDLLGDLLDITLYENFDYFELQGTMEALKNP